MENRNPNNTKLWKRMLCIILSVIMGLGTFVTLTFGNFLLSDWIDIKEAFAATSISAVPVFYRHGELVGLYRVNYTADTTIQYKIGEDGEWTDYSVPFSIPAHQTTKVYARIGEDGKATYMNLSTTDEASEFMKKAIQTLNFPTIIYISAIPVPTTAPTKIGLNLFTARCL